MVPRPILLQIIKTSCLSLAIFLFLYAYVGLRHEELSLFIVNKTAAGVAGILLGIVILTGPLSRLFPGFGFLTMYRKWLGIAAFLFAYLHGMVTLFFLPNHFPFSRFTLQNTAFLFALVCLCILFLLFALSFDMFTKTLNHVLWWHVQNWGVRIAFLTGVIHAGLVKYRSWIGWFLHQDTGLGEIMPPAGLLIIEFLLFIIVVRLLELLPRQFARKAIVVAAILFVLIFGGNIVGGILLNVSP